MKKSIIPFLLLTLSFLGSFSQNCDCVADFDWMVHTFKTNDAGFSYVIEKKGLDEYVKHTELSRQKAMQTDSMYACLKVMQDWLAFFRKGHIGIHPKGGYGLGSGNPQLSEKSKDSIRSLYKNEETVNLTESGLKDLLRVKAGKTHPIEGVWKNNNYTIGIIRSAENSRKFTAFIIKADSIYWVPQQKKAELTLRDDSSFSMIYSMRDHSLKNETARMAGKSGNLLMMINTLWLKVYPEQELSQRDQLYIKLRSSTNPFLESLSRNTLYLRIPSFQYEKKPLIDSVLSKYDSVIRTRPNLIIDIRNGTGGSDLSFYHLLPYLYTQPIREVDMQFYATELNAEQYDDWANTIKDPAQSEYCRNVAKKMRQNPGSFIVLDSSRVSIDSSYKAIQTPSRVAIICNQYNGSTDESFLLKAKQSLKVKIFGRPTFGVLDFSNIHIVESPDGLFNLIYCMTTSFRIPDFPIDGIGVQPDFFIDETIPEEDWVSYVQSVVER